MDKIQFSNEKLSCNKARELMEGKLEEITSYLEDNPVLFHYEEEGEGSSFTIYNDLFFKGHYYDIYGKFSYKKERFEECRIFLTVTVDCDGETKYKDTIEEDDISALTDYLLEIEELVYQTEKENRQKEKNIAAQKEKNMKIKVLKFVVSNCAYHCDAKDLQDAYFRRKATELCDEETIERTVNAFIEGKDIVDIKVTSVETRHHGNGRSNDVEIIYTIMYK